MEISQERLDIIETFYKNNNRYCDKCGKSLRNERTGHYFGNDLHIDSAPRMSHLCNSCFEEFRLAREELLRKYYKSYTESCNFEKNGVLPSVSMPTVRG